MLKSDMNKFEQSIHINQQYFCSKLPDITQNSKIYKKTKNRRIKLKNHKFILQRMSYTAKVKTKTGKNNQKVTAKL